MAVQIIYNLCTINTNGGSYLLQLLSGFALNASKKLYTLFRRWGHGVSWVLLMVMSCIGGLFEVRVNSCYVTLMKSETRGDNSLFKQ